jgi:hypothetical protein
MNVKVSIPASLGGYTGQRDEWEEFENDWNVIVAGDTVTLQHTGSIGRTFKFQLSDLNEAVAFILKQKAGQ